MHPKYTNNLLNLKDVKVYKVEHSDTKVRINNLRISVLLVDAKRSKFIDILPERTQDIYTFVFKYF